MTTLLKTYINLIKLNRKKHDLMGQIILGIIQHKIEGHDEEKRILIATLKRIPYLEKPDKLQEFMDEFFKPGKVKVYDLYRESMLNYHYFKFSSAFKKKVKDLLWKEK